MFGIEAWHLWAVGSVIAAGLFSFLVKIGAERSHGSALLNSVASVSSFICAAVAVAVMGGSWGWVVVGAAVANAVMYIFGTVARSDALAHIHAALFFPIYKIVGPTIVLVAGVAVFGERLTVLQSLGFLLALSVPALLIDRLEYTRQKDLRLGVRLAVWSAVLISVGQVLAKVATAHDGVYPFIVIVYAMTAAGTWALHTRTNRVVEAAPRLRETVVLGAVGGILQFLGFAMLLEAFRTGAIGTVYAINSTYIVIPIVLSIIFYGEHWNARKAAAVALSVLAVVLLR